MYHSESHANTSFAPNKTTVLQVTNEAPGHIEDHRKKSTCVLPSWILEERESAAIARRRKLLEDRAKRIHDPRVTSIAVSNDNWRPPSLSKLTPLIFMMGITHLGSEASISDICMAK